VSELLERIRALVDNGHVKISEHGYDELVNDGLSARELIQGVQEALVVEEYRHIQKVRAFF
jgi:hypothetical protein